LPFFIESVFGTEFSRLFSVSQQYFSLTTNQSTVLLAAYFQPKQTYFCGALTGCGENNRGRHGRLA
jgi:hypothetical protein